MLDNILRRDDVSKLIYEVVNNARYYDKKSDNSVNYQLYVDREQALFVVYDALLKYKIIIDDLYFFDDYIEQINKLFRKLDNFNDICSGINRLIGNVCATKLGIKDVEILEYREKILRYIYDKYVLNGYYVHGYSNCYEDNIKDNGFVPEEYDNYYNDFMNVNRIFAKYNVLNILDKNFSSRDIYFTDSFVMGCYYSINSPGYFYRLLCNKDYSYLKIKKDAYLKSNYDDCLKNLKKLFSAVEVSEHDRKYVFDVVKKEWDLLHKKERNISLLLVKRNKFDVTSSVKIDKLVEDASISMGDAVNRILIPRNNRIVCNKKILSEDICFINLDFIKEEVSVEDRKEEEKRYRQEMIMYEFNNVYGKVSLLLLLGSLSITLGVIITIIRIIGG